MGRYKIAAKEIKDYLHGKYGQAPAPVDADIAKQIVGDDEVIACRPADLLQPEFESLKEKYSDIAKSDEDVLSLALLKTWQLISWKSPISKFAKNIKTKPTFGQLPIHNKSIAIPKHKILKNVNTFLTIILKYDFVVLSWVALTSPASTLLWTSSQDKPIFMSFSTLSTVFKHSFFLIVNIISKCKKK